MRLQVLRNLADALHSANDAIIWRTSKTGRKYMIETTTGEIVGGAPFATKKQIEAEKRFTAKELHDNMEKAVKALVGVTCYRVKGISKIKIRNILDHANLRMLERKVAPGEIKDALQSPVFCGQGNVSGTAVFYSNKVFVVASSKGELKTCIRITKGRKILKSRS